VAIFSKDDSNEARGGKGGAGGNTLSIIAAGTTVSGDIDCTGVLKVEGRVDGNILRARQVMLARAGSIHGDVSANEVVVGGVIDGNVTAEERLELQSSAVVNGDILTRSIVVMEGARINGAVKMTELALVGSNEESHEGKDARAARR